MAKKGKRGERHVRRQCERRKCRSEEVRVRTLNVSTMDGEGRELADMMNRHMVDIMCVQETKWKRSKAIGALEVGSNCSTMV